MAEFHDTGQGQEFYRVRVPQLLLSLEKLTRQVAALTDAVNRLAFASERDLNVRLVRDAREYQPEDIPRG